MKETYERVPYARNMKEFPMQEPYVPSIMLRTYERDVHVKETHVLSLL